MHKYSFIIIHLKTMDCLVSKFKTRIYNPLLNIYGHYIITEDDKMNRTKNNEHK